MWLYFILIIDIYKHHPLCSVYEDVKQRYKNLSLSTAKMTKML